MEKLSRKNWGATALEVAALLAVELSYFASCYLIKINPVDRLSQVSAVAALGYRFLCFAVPMLTALWFVAKYRPAWWLTALRMTCAALAGLVSAMLAGGLVCMLHGTPYGLGGDGGDSGVLASWAVLIQQGYPTPGQYPPLQMHVIAWLSDLFSVPPIYAMRKFQILSMLLLFPLGYAAWRSLLRAPWALVLGMVCALPLIEFYRQYPLLVLLTFLPVIIKFLDVLRTAPTRSPRQLAVLGAVLGGVLGVQFLMYMGWFQWSAPGVFLVALAVFPWRTNWRHGAILCGAAAFVFLALCGYTIARVVAAPGVQDEFFYFDVYVDPMYIAMWRTAMPGAFEHLWPLPGEMGGVSVFMVSLCAGWGAALAFGRRYTAVIALSWILLGAWLLRLNFARHMAQTHLVQLYPRTTTELVYGMLALTGFAVYAWIERRREVAAEGSPLRDPHAVIGVLVGSAMLCATAAASAVDRYMPKLDTNEFGYMSQLAHDTPREGQDLARRDGHVIASSNGDKTGYFAIDRDPSSAYESDPSPTSDHEEWIEIRFKRIHTFSRVQITPATDGFPVDFVIEVSDGVHWNPRVSKTGQVQPSGPQSFSWDPFDRTDRVRLRATKLGTSGGAYKLRIAKFEVFR